MKRLSKGVIKLLVRIAIIVIVVSIGAIISYFRLANISELNVKSDENVEAISNLQSDIDKVDYSSSDTAVLAGNANRSISSSKYESDNEVANETFEFAFTWNTGRDYQKVRTSLEANYGIDKDSQFLTEFMPPIAEIEDPETGSITNTIDMYDYDVSYGGMNPIVTHTDGLVYDYLTEVAVSTENVNGDTASTTLVLTYTMDEDSNISDLIAMTTNEDFTVN